MRVALAVCLLLALAQSGEDKRLVAGVVVDEEGRPLVEAEVAEEWIFRTNGRQHGGAYAHTDAQGAFRIAVPAGEDARLLTAYSKDELLAGVVQVAGEDERVTIRMAQAVKVEIRVRTGENGLAPETVQVAWHARRGEAKKLGPVVAQAVSWNGLLKCTLPPGKYDWLVSDIDFVTRLGKADLRPKANCTTFEVILPPSFVARHMGKRLPEWTVTEARGVPLDEASLASFRGKWTFIEFWSFT